MSRSFLLVVLFALATIVPATAQPDEHDLEGTIVVGHGRPGIVHGFDYFVVDSPTGLIGFDYTGAIRYVIEPISYGDGIVYRIVIVAPVGAHDVGFTLDWVEQGSADVLFETPADFQTNCVDPFCLS